MCVCGGEWTALDFKDRGLCPSGVDVSVCSQYTGSVWEACLFAAAGRLAEEY